MKSDPFELNQCALFSGMSESEIEECLSVSQARIISCEKDSYLFHQGELPRYMMVLLSGSIIIGNDSLSGKRNIIATFHEHGEMFGEIFLFLNKKEYDYFAQADSDSQVLQIPKSFFDTDSVNQNSFSYRLIANLLPVFAGKAYYLNQKLRIISGASLRQKIARMLLQNACSHPSSTLSDSRSGSKSGSISGSAASTSANALTNTLTNASINALTGTFYMNRERMADYLGVARPSLSRELSNMQNEGLIVIEKRQIHIKNLSALQEII